MKKAFRIGSISLVFLIIGFQTALLVSRASILFIEAKRDRPDTVFVYCDSSLLGHEMPNRHCEAQSTVAISESKDGITSSPAAPRNDGVQTALSYDKLERHNAKHSDVVNEIREKTKKVENFPFNPNTISKEELERLGFSSKQAASIVNYRNKGGKFRRPSDFAKSFVVSDSIFRRLEPYIDIPKIDINKADSAQLTQLPGIGPFYARKIIEYRTRLGGTFSRIEQLMDIENIDYDRFSGFSDLIVCSANN